MPTWRRVDDAIGRRDVVLQGARDAAARRAVILGETSDERFGARSVAVMDDEKPDAQIHQGIGNGVPGAARPNQHDRRALRGVAPERFPKL